MKPFYCHIAIAMLCLLLRVSAAKANDRIIGDFEVVGNKTLGASAIITLSGHKVGDPCTKETLADMRDRLARTGNFGMHHPDQQDQWVRIQAEDDGEGKCHVVIIVDENDRITSITITGTGPVKPEVIKKLIYPGIVYNYDDMDRDIHSIRDYYEKGGYSITFGKELGPDIYTPGSILFPIIVSKVGQIVIEGASPKQKSRILKT